MTTPAHPGRAAAPRRPLRVLQSFPEPRSTTNPYVVQLREALDALPEVEVQTFGWRRALTGRYDLLHLHWPEILVTGRNPTRTRLRQLLVGALLLRLRVMRTPVVRTVHNIRPQEERTGLAAALLRRLDRLTRFDIRLNERTPARPGIPGRLIAHGHYRDWFARFPRVDRQPGHLAFTGLIRPYKGVDRLLAAFADTRNGDLELSLHVAGAPHSAALAAEVRRAAAADDRVSLSLHYLSEAELVTAVSRAELVVLPYREMHNSGAALLALSLDRPVLVPGNEVNAALAAEVGQGWVLRYDGDLTAATLVRAVTAARTVARPPRPDLTRREWARAATEHAEVYAEAWRLARGTRRYSR